LAQFRLKLANKVSLHEHIFYPFVRFSLLLATFFIPIYATWPIGPVV
jgi:hypothetical protein